LFDENACVLTNKKLNTNVQANMTANIMFQLDVATMENFALAASTKDDPSNDI